jgi:hypothetical protein
MSPDPHLNPYAPPTAEVGVRVTEQEPTTKRPPSVKWALALFLFGFAVLFILNGQLLAKEGWRTFVEASVMEPWSILEPISRLIALIALLFGGRRPWVYWTTVGALGIFLCGLPGALAPQFALAMAGRDLFITTMEFIVPIIMVALLFWLFYRITFGRPSRLYFRVAKP